MNKQLVIVFLLLFGVQHLYGQTARTSVYFKSDKTDLAPKQQQTLDTLIHFLADKEIKKIIIKGNTDSDADSLYNLTLSEKRALAVKGYLIDRSFDPRLFKTGFFGEEKPIAPNEQDAGKQQNRRVDVVVYYKETIIIEDTVTQPMRTSSTDTCKRDTVIFLPQGSNYTINICDYRKYGHCISIIEYITPESVLNSGLSTLTSTNEQLVTGGMFEIRLCNDSPLVQPLKFRVPVPFNGRPPEGGCGGEVNYKKMALWTAAGNGAWGGRKKIPVVKVDTNLFYEFTVIRSGKYNLDYKMDEKNLNNIKTRFISRGNIKLTTVSMMYPSPQSLFQQSPQKGNKVLFKLPNCPQNGCDCILIKAEGINAAGDTVVTTNCMNNYKKRLMFGKCKLKRGRTAGHFLGFIPIRQKGIYRKYIFEPKDWKVKN